MNLSEFALLLTGVLLNATAQLLLKRGSHVLDRFELSVDNALPIGWQLITQPSIIGALCCYVVSVVIWILVLSKTEVSIAYPMLSIGYVVNAYFAWWWLGEALSVARIVGIFIIIIGVCLVAKS